MQTSDPFRTLGIASDATADDVRAARRRLAKRLHPDRGGDARRMQDLNAAASDALAMIEAGTNRASGAGRREGEPPARSGSPGGPTRQPPPPPKPPATAERGRTGRAEQRRAPWRVIEDVPSFVVEGPPDATFSLLEATAGSVGTVLEADEPFVLDVALRDPMRCWCRLELLPEGASTSVNLYIGGLGEVVGAPAATTSRVDFPDIDEVRDTWIAALNAAQWPQPPR